jgi:preprotein translocase subunit SecE
MATRTNPFTFLQQVRAEVSKVVWPTRRETVISTVMVFGFAALAALFFLAVDGALSWGVRTLLGINV